MAFMKMSSYFDEKNMGLVQGNIHIIGMIKPELCHLCKKDHLLHTLNINNNF